MDLKFIIDDISNKIGELIKKSPTKDIENNIKTLINSAISKLNITTKEEFELQQNIILDLSNRIDKLENKINKLLKKNNKNVN